MIQIRLGIFILVFPAAAWAGPTEQILKTAWSDETVLTVNQLKVESQSPGTSLIRQGQVFYAREQDYKKEGAVTHEVGLKIQPMSAGEIKIHKSQALALIDPGKVQLSKALLDRYEMIIKYHQVVKKTELLTQVAEAAMKNFRTQLLASQIGRSDAKKIIKARLDWARIQKDLKEAQIQKKQVGEKLKQLAGVSEFNDSASWVSPVDIQKKIDSFEKTVLPVSAQLEQAGLQDMTAEHEIFMSRRQAWMDSFEVAYSRPERVDRESSVEVKVTLNLPFLGRDESSAIKNREFARKKISAFRQVRELNDLFKANIERLKEMIQLHGQLNGFLNNPDLFKKSASLDPQLGIETLFEGLAARSEFLDLERDILLLYVQALFESGRMISSPEVNYLSRQEGQI